MLSGGDTDRWFVVVAETRRVWTRTEKEAIVAEAMVDGAVVAQVTRRHDLNPNLLYRWRREFAAEAADRMRGGRSTKEDARRRAEADEPAVSRPALPAPERGCDGSSGTAWIEVELRNGRRLRCPPDIEPRRLAQLAVACERS